MTASDPARTRVVQSLLLAGLVSLAAVVPALAGECPAGKVGDNAPSGTQTALPAHGNPGNGGKVTVVLTIADIVNDKKPATMEKMM